MIRYVAFLRGINVAGQKSIKMEALREIMVMPGIKNIVTYIQSGNIAFDSKETINEALQQKIEKKLLKDLGFEVPVVVRSVDELKKLIDSNPFGNLKEGDERAAYVHFLSTEPAVEKHAALVPFIAEDEELILRGKEIHLLTPRYGNTKLTNSLIEKKTGTTSTARNWNTINKMVTL